MEKSTQELVKKLNSNLGYLKESSVIKINEAVNFAIDIHDKQLRESGEPYVNHVLATAILLSDIHLDEASIIAGLLHDTLEDSNLDPKVLMNLFGKEVLSLVDGVTKVSQIKLKKSTIELGSQQQIKELESLRKLFLAMAKDLRVVLIKLADRLHNLRTLEFIPIEKQYRIAKESMEIYVPLANRLGLWQIKSDLEDNCFRYLAPDDFKEIYKEVAKKTTRGEKYIEAAIKIIHQQLNKAGLDRMQIYGRTKNLYGIYLKTLYQHKSIDEIYDIYAVRIIAPDIPTCYTVLGIIHNLWKPIPGRFKDYIAVPKSNGYQSLHTSVFAINGQKLEIQIRTEEMHQHAEQGIAAHWLYKEKNKSKKEFNWIMELSRLKEVDIRDLSSELKINIFEDRIFVYTPKGDIRDLPKGSTPIDFAYSVHSAIGDRLIGAKVNQKIVSLDYMLQNGDIVDILTSKQSLGPKRQWLEIVKTNIAKSKIRTHLKKNNTQENTIVGQKIIDDEFLRLNLPLLQTLPQTKVRTLLDKLHLRSATDLYLHTSNGDISVKKIIKILFPTAEVLQIKKVKNQHLNKEFSQIVFGNNQYLPYKISSQCCQAKYPRPIIGYITRGKGISVHQIECKSIRDKDPQRLIFARWEKSPDYKYTANLEIKCTDRIGMMHDISEVAMNHSVNIISINTQQDSKKCAKIILAVSINDLDHLATLMSKINDLPGVIGVIKT